MAPPSHANSRPRQANAQSSSNSDGCASHDGWMEIRQKPGKASCCEGGRVRSAR